MPPQRHPARRHPLILQGSDVLATAQTGSGKTAAYCLPLLQQWLSASVAAAASCAG
jgi:superfamily II DNA/RNA helicase